MSSAPSPQLPSLPLPEGRPSFSSSSSGGLASPENLPQDHGIAGPSPHSGLTGGIPAPPGKRPSVDHPLPQTPQTMTDNDLPPPRPSFQSQESANTFATVSSYEAVNPNDVPSPLEFGAIVNGISPGTIVPAIGVEGGLPRSGSGSGAGDPSNSTNGNFNNSHPTQGVSIPTSPILDGNSGGGGDSTLVEDVVPTDFDESSLRSLCDMDCAMPLLLDRIKQNMSSSKEAMNFFRKRAQIEETYGRALVKLAKDSRETYSNSGSEVKAGTYVTSFQAFLKTHELVGENRIKFAQGLSLMADETSNLIKEVEKQRKQGKEIGMRMERALMDSELATEKARQRVEQTAEELERFLVTKSGESSKDPGLIPHFGAGGSSPVLPSGKRTFGKAIGKFKSKNPQQIAKQEDDIRTKMGNASNVYSKLYTETQKMRQDYFALQLPRVLRSLKESADEIDMGTQYHLSRYAYLYEHTMVQDGLTISPIGFEDGPGLKSLVESIDNREDFKTYMQHYSLAYGMSGNKGPSRIGPEEALLSPPPLPASRPSVSSEKSDPNPFSPTSPLPESLPEHVSKATFGVPLEEQLMRDQKEIPRVLERCADVIEQHLDSMGIYRLSGTTSKVQRLKAALDQDVEAVDFNDDKWADINDVTSALKLWFRELPEPLLTYPLYNGFIEASRIENSRLRHIRVHERVNELPDANYATLKYFMGHLDKVRKRDDVNQMSISNLAIVFGPNLLGPSRDQPPNMADMALQCKAVETILEHYEEIFVDTEGEGG